MSSTIAIRPETPETINSLADAVFPAMAMLAGMKLDVFTPLKNGPLTTDEIAVEIGVPPRRNSMQLPRFGWSGEDDDNIIHRPMKP